MPSLKYLFLVAFVLSAYPEMAVSSNVRLLNDGSVECVSSLEPTKEADVFYARRNCEYIGNSCVKGSYVIYPRWRDGSYVEEAHEQVQCATTSQLPELCETLREPGPLFPNDPQVTTQICDYKKTNDGKAFMKKFVCTELSAIPQSPYRICPVRNMRDYYYYTTADW